MFEVNSKFKVIVTEDELKESAKHVFKVLSANEFRSVVPSPLAEDFAMEWLDEFSAWAWIVHIRENHVSGKRWSIDKPLVCAKCLWTALGNIPVNDDSEIEETFLHFESGTDCHDIWHWFESEFELSVATDLMNLK
jgi:hypothetical protein